MSDPHWQRYADLCAFEAHDLYFTPRRGIWRYLDMPGILVIYNNHPYVGAPRRRDREEQLLREWFATADIDELAASFWPRTGPYKGYSTAIVVACYAGRRDEVWDAWKRIRQQARKATAANRVHAPRPRSR